jgi:phospholipase/lecithinase/hemolysin
MRRNNTLGMVIAFFTVLNSISLWGATERQILACSYYDMLDTSVNSSLVHAGLPWVWAKGLNGESIYVYGHQVNNFFQVGSIIGEDESYFGTHVIDQYQNTTDTARGLCERAIVSAFPQSYATKSLISMMVKTSFLSIHHMQPSFEQLSHNIQQQIKYIIAFGDSISDQGNLKSWLRGVPGAPYFGGRFSNGPNWLDYLHLETGVPIQNWAVGGAVTHMHPEDSHRFSTHIAGSVSEQIARFAEYIQEYTPVIQDPDNTLFVVWAGGNDYLSKLYSKHEVNSFIDEPNNPNAGSNIIIERVTDDIKQHLHTLYNLGARKFLVPNMPDFGIMPKIMEFTYYQRYAAPGNTERLITLSRRLSQLTMRHNQQLKNKIHRFLQEFPDAQVVYSDVHQQLRSVVNSRSFFKSSRYFSYRLDPNFIVKLESGRRPVVIHQACYVGQIWGSDACSTICETPNKNLFWDSLHPSSFGHNLIALANHRALFKSNLMTSPMPNNYVHRCRPDLDF